MRLGTSFILAMLLAPLVAAEDMYVTDQLDLALRSGKSIRHKILQMVPTGEKVEVLASADGYVKVRTERGTTGWMLSRHLMNEPAARARLAIAEQQAARLTSENETLGQASQRNAELSSREAELEKQLEEIRRTAAGAINLAEQNRQLKRDLLQNNKEMQSLNQQVVTLTERSDQQWFLVGAIVVLISIFLGHMLPRMSLKRGSNLDNF